jgi:thiamine-monophosphate kinase
MNENRIVQLLKSRYSRRSVSIKKGIGDDAAVIRPRGASEYLLITSDMLLEGVDFRVEWTTPLQLGQKAIAVNLSDLAAMGARPRAFTVSLAVTRGISERWIRDFYDGLTDPKHSMGAHLIGGDLSSSRGGISISVTALGESLERKVLYRHGGRAGDIVYVTGVLGRSAAGLKLLQKSIVHPRTEPQRAALRSHLSPLPRCEAGLWLAQSGFVRCMMDLSDGLSADLPRMCAASGVGAEIDEAHIPVLDESRGWGFNPLQLALHGGEDYELLFAVSKRKADLFEKVYPSNLPRVTRVGRLISDASKILMISESGRRFRLLDQGFDHFR